MSRAADRHVLFGILAAQLDFVTRDALIAAMNVWLLDKSRPLGEILREQGRLSSDELRHLNALVEVHIQRHGNDAQRSLEALSSVDIELGQQLAALPDTDIQATIEQIGLSRVETASVAASPALGQARSAGSSAGRYRILKPHARGGLGEVFVAEDTELGRQVALKQIQVRHADDQDSRGRFVLEAEVTGGLEHPGIVPVYGLGSYADGRPFYAMRFIKGDNLKDAIIKFHSNAPEFDSLAFRELLGRFVDVCQAVAYAHSRGVLHRDLKPGNIMLGKYGETLVVDWGLAKALGRSGSGDVGDASLKPHSGSDLSATAAGHALGTPAYMPPEQAAGDWDQLGPASDVYSLGATLYELLTGKPPFESRMIELILDDVREGRFTPPGRIVEGVPRPLEAVCLKAMAQKPADRYDSALTLAAEVEHWLADEPVTAWREPTSVRLRRWVRRHSRLVTGVAAGLLVAALSFGALAWQREKARQAVENERAATAHERDEKELARQKAIESLAQVERGIGMLSSIFKDLDPLAEDKEGTPLRALLGDRLESATAQLSDTAVGDPVAVAKLQMRLGETQLGLGFSKKAIALFLKARETLASQLGDEHPDTLACIGALAEGYRIEGDFEPALRNFELSLSGFKKSLGPNHPSTLSGMASLGLAYLEAGRLESAIPMLEDAHKLLTSTLGPMHAETLTNMGNLASGYRAIGKLDAAIALLEETLKLKRIQFGPDHPLTLFTLNTLAVSYHDAGNLEAAMPLYEETLRLRRQRLGPEHPTTLTAMNNLGRGYLKSGNPDAAMPLLERTLELRKVKLGADHPSTLISMDNLAQGYQTVGQLPAATRLYEETLALRTAKLGSDHPETLSTMNNLAGAHRAAKNLTKSFPLYEKTYELRKAKLGPHHADSLHSLANLAREYLAMNDPDHAMPLYREYLDVNRRDLKKNPSRFARLQISVALDLLDYGRAAEAEPNLRESLAIREKFEPELWSTFNTKSLLGKSLSAQKKYRDAEPMLLAGYEGMQARAAKMPTQSKARILEAAERLVQHYEMTGNVSEVSKWKKVLLEAKDAATATQAIKEAKP